MDQAVDDDGCLLFGGLGQMGVARRGGGAGVTQYALHMTQTPAPFEQMGGEAMPQGVDRDFFVIPHWVTTACMAAWVPPRSMWVVARRIRSGEPTARGKSKWG